MAVTINALPTEILGKVIRYAAKDSNLAIISCLLVNQLWRDVSLPILYRDLVLSCGQLLDRFIACHNRQALPLTQSFTFYLNHDDQSDALDKAKCDKTELLIPLLANVIPSMTNLKSFSLIRHHRTTRNPAKPWSEAHLYKTTRSTISSLLNSLPISCISLEIAVGDTNGSKPDQDPTHLCENLRGLLPRMQHIHINLDPVCDAMLGTWDEDKIFHPIGLPHLRSLHLDCIENDEWADLYQPRPLTTWGSLVHGLQQVATLPETPASAEIKFLDVSASGGESDKSIYRTYLRCNIRKEARDTKTWAFPVTWLAGLNHRQAHYIRMRDGEAYVVLDARDFVDIAGGRPWRTLATGTRLPTAWTRGEALMADYGIFEYAEWTETHPKRHPMLIRNERLAGQCLISAEEREGYQNTASLVEQTPEGFVRYGGPVWRNWRLYGADEQGPEDYNPDEPNPPVG